MNKTKLKRVGGIACNAALYFFLALCVFAVILTVFSKKDADGATEIFGYQMRVVTSNSMEKCELTDVSGYEIKSIPLHSMIFVDLVPEEKDAADAWYASLREGDVLTFRYVYASQVTITHRIASPPEKVDGGYVIRLAGDNKNADSDQLYQTIDTSDENSMNYVIGKVTGQSYLLGLLVSLLKNPIGIVLIVIVPCFIIILLEVLKIVGAYGAIRKKREQEERAEKDNELAELRRRLAELEQRTDGAPAVPTAETDAPSDGEKAENAEDSET